MKKISLLLSLLKKMDIKKLKILNKKKFKAVTEYPVL